jgi:translation elongation factor EF-G
MARYLEDGADPSPDELHAPFERALRAGHLMPILFVSARTGAGVPQLLDALAKLAPNPAEGNPPPFYRGEPGEEPQAFAGPARRQPARAGACVQGGGGSVHRQDGYVPGAPGHGAP